MPKVRQAANDRAPTKEELQKLLEYPDRVRCIFMNIGLNRKTIYLASRRPNVSI